MPLCGNHNPLIRLAVTAAMTAMTKEHGDNENHVDSDSVKKTTR